MNTSKVKALTEKWIEAKGAENAAREFRIEIEEKLTAILGVKPEGSKTHTVENYKITITGKINRTLDVAQWENIKDQIAEGLRPVIYKPSIDLTGLRYIKNNEPEVYNIASQAITSKPGKPGVSIKESK